MSHFAHEMLCEIYRQPEALRSTQALSCCGTRKLLEFVLENEEL